VHILNPAKDEITLAQDDDLASLSLYVVVPGLVSDSDSETNVSESEF